MLHQPHIVVVDDDRPTGAILAEYLGHHGYRVTALDRAGPLAGLLEGAMVDLVLLDLGLPDADGLEIARALRVERDLPVIIVSGRAAAIDRIVGLEVGADDYLAKPFELRELLARVRAVLHRARPHEAAPAGHAFARFAGWELNLRSRTLRQGDGDAVPLTRAEFALLSALLDHPHQVLSREQLLALVHVHADEAFDRSIDVQILRLRRKIEVDPHAPALIRTERGAGYVLAAAVERR